MAGIYDGAVQELIDELGHLPGVGPKSAQRIAFHILGADAAEALAGHPRGLRHVLATFGKVFLVVILALVAATIVLNVLVALGVVRW